VLLRRSSLLFCDVASGLDAGGSPFLPQNQARRVGRVAIDVGGYLEPRDARSVVIGLGG
jgi:hypothetical protein